MRHGFSKQVGAPGALLLLWCWIALPACVGAESELDVHGILTDVEPLRVLRVWGTPQERGYAHGFLLAEEIVALLEQQVAATEEWSGLEDYGELLEAVVREARIASHYEEELRGVLAGVEARLDGLPRIATLDRALRYEDLLTFNALFDFMPMHGAAFAAWDELTSDAQTLAGCNLDLADVSALRGAQLLLAQLPGRDGPQRGWVAVAWPGMIGCVAGMNTDGVALSLQGVSLELDEPKRKFTPQALTLRTALETPAKRDPIYEVSPVLRTGPVRAASNVLIAMPNQFDEQRPPGCVVEWVGRLSAEYDFVSRLRRARHCDGRSDDFICCTNLLKEYQFGPDACPRYLHLADALPARLANADPLTVESAWQLLGEVESTGAEPQRGLTQYAVLFEPYQRRLHVACAQRGKPAPQCPKVTLDLRELLSGDPTD